MLRVFATVLTALVLVSPGVAGDAELLRARDRYLPASTRDYAATPDGAQSRYDAGRNLVEAVLAAGSVRAGLRPLRAELLRRGRTVVARAEALDRPDGSRGAGRYAPLPLAPSGVALRASDAALDGRLAAVAERFDGWTAIWTHELRTGRFAGWNEDLRFPAASTVKLGVLAAALRTSPVPEAGRWWYDARQLGAWSSNLAANRILAHLGSDAVSAGLRRLGMTSSTYPGPYRATTAVGSPPPGNHTRVTTASDLGRALYRLHAGAYGDRRALRLLGLTRSQAQAGVRILLSSQRASDNVGLLRPWLGVTRVAEKNGWLTDTRLTAAIVYGRRGPVIVVVAAYRPTLEIVEARRLGWDVLRAIGL
ncbi:MAG: class A beta-lactamase-related serine hydrolase [Gaiellaceae bacterium MAG52_C11]|nr:class A beta-lactamase-related serine hydrolase [Candidatus Gaiellasilicea maunaloa]